MGVFRIPFRFLTTEDGCYMCISHKVNVDGYLRVNFNGELIMFHRLMWQHYNGTVPAGHEIHHKCNSRNCCNLDHLQLIGISEHKSITNASRYAERTKSISCLKGGDKELVAKQFKVSTDTVHKIWKRSD